MTFVPNVGQTDDQVLYLAHAGLFGARFTNAGVELSLRASRDKVDTLALEFVGGVPAPRVVARAPQPGRVNYFLGGDPSKWRAGVPTYSELEYEDVWPGIDVRFRSAPGRLKYEFVVSPGADPSAIRLRYAGVRRLSLDDQGNLIIATASGVLADERPVERSARRRRGEEDRDPL